jgi:two-component system cell cycle response regulator
MEKIEKLLSQIKNPELALELRKLFEELIQSALTDSLTGLYNRRYFEQLLTVRLERAKQEESPLSVLFIDVDNFKSINDRLGHPIGDQVLRQVASLMQKHLRQVDVITRFGGEEFAAVLPDADDEQAMCVAERLRKAVAEGTFLGQRLTVSCGIASFPTHATDSASLVMLADQAMYHAKAASKNKVVIAGQFELSRGKKATLGYLHTRQRPASIWTEGQFFLIKNWRQIGHDASCYLAQTDKGPIYLHRRGESWFAVE